MRTRILTPRSETLFEGFGLGFQFVVNDKGVVTDLDSPDVASLQPYREEHWYHLGWGGLFRKHPEWSE